MELTKIYHKNKGVKSLFSEDIIIDYYDGLVTGLAKLDTTEIWLACNMCYFEPTKRERIFTLISIDEDVVEQLKPLRDQPKPGEYSKQDEQDFHFMMGLIRKCFNEYNGKVFLMKCSHISDINYEIVEIPNKEMRFFEEINLAQDQPKKEIKKWLSFFEGKK